MRLIAAIVFSITFTLEPALAWPLFKVQKGKRVNWALGTLHSVNVEEADMPAEFVAILDQTRVLLSESGARATTLRMRKRVSDINQEESLQSHYDIKALLSPDDWDVFREIIGEENIERAQRMGVITLTQAIESVVMSIELTAAQLSLERLVPGQLRWTEFELQFEREKLRRGINEENMTGIPQMGGIAGDPMEIALAELAEKKKIKIRALDSVKHVERMYRQKFAPDDLAAYLRAVVNRANDLVHLTPNEIAEILADHLAREPRHIWKNLKDWVPGKKIHAYTEPIYFPRAAQPLLQRHNHWMRTIESEFSKGGVFLIVGAAHLSPDFLARNGDRTVGILRQLEAAGFNVTHLGDSESCATHLTRD